MEIEYNDDISRDKEANNEEKISPIQPKKVLEEIMDKM